MSIGRKELEGIITTADFDNLMGEVENDWFECKSEPYQVRNEAGKRELAKDVSSFANAQGGYIFIGIKTKTSATHFGDEVEGIRVFEQGLVDTEKYHDLIRAWIYPEIEKISIQWIPSNNDSGKGLVVIKIPQQEESSKPFLIRKCLDGEKHVEIMFGYSERKRDKSQPLTVVDLQRALQSGFNYEGLLKERLDSIEASVELLTSQSLTGQEKSNIEKITDERIEKTLGHDDIRKKRILILIAYPSK